MTELLSTTDVETLELIQRTAQEAKGAAGKVQLIDLATYGEPKGTYATVTSDGAFERHTAAPTSRKHVLGTLAEVGPATERAAANKWAPSTWYDESAVVVLLDDSPASLRRDRAAYELGHTEEFAAFLDAQEKTFDQKHLLQLIRRELWKAIPEETRDELVAVLRNLSYTNSTTGHGSTGPGRASYGSDIEGEIKSNAGDLKKFERLTLSFRIFDDPALTIRRRIQCLLEDNPLERSFQLVALGGEIQAALDDELAHIGELLQDTCEGPVIYGKPE